MVRASGLESFVLDRSPRTVIVYAVFLAPLRPCVFAFISVDPSKNAGSVPGFHESSPPAADCQTRYTTKQPDLYASSTTWSYKESCLKIFEALTKDDDTKHYRFDHLPRLGLQGTLIAFVFLLLLVGLIWILV